MTGATDIRTLTAGAPLDRARGAVVLLHGRGGTAEDILALSHALSEPDFAYVAPQAPGNTWYPLSFLAPIDENEPALSRALATVDAVVGALSQAGIAPDRVALVGFSQGGCLALEYAARNVRRCGGVAGLSSGLIAPPGTPRTYAGWLAGTPVFLGCSDVDAHGVGGRADSSRTSRNGARDPEARCAVMVPTHSGRQRVTTLVDGDMWIYVS